GLGQRSARTKQQRQEAQRRGRVPVADRRLARDLRVTGRRSCGDSGSHRSARECLRVTSKQIIKQHGKPAFVVIPYDEWRLIEAVIEDRTDAAAVRDYLEKPEQGLPEDVVRAIVLDGASPIKVLREHRGLTQAALAGATGTSALYLSQI